MIEESITEATTKTKILNATLKLMSQKHFENISTRDILEKAKVSNSSAISYHFGSKDNLIRRALQYYLTKMRQLFLDHENAGGDPEKVLMDLCLQFAQYILNNPGFEKNMLIKIISNEGIDPDFSIVMKQNIESFKKIISRINGCNNDKTLFFKAVSLMSSLIYPFLLGHYGKETNGIDYTDLKNITGYLKLIINGIK